MYDDVEAHGANHTGAELRCERERKREYAERREHEHPPHEQGHHVGDTAEEFHHRRLCREGEPSQGQSEREREHDQRQHRTVRGRLDRVRWHDTDQPTPEAGQVGTLHLGDSGADGLCRHRIDDEPIENWRSEDRSDRGHR